MERETGETEMGAVNEVNEYRQAIIALTSGDAESVSVVVQLDDGNQEKQDLAVHPLAQMIPLISPGDLDRLTDDIIVNGVNEPLNMFQGKVLDGRNRLAVASVTGTAVRLRDFTGDEAAARAYVWSVNIARRQLSIPQLALAADRFGLIAEAQAKPGSHLPARVGGVAPWAHEVSRRLGREVSPRTLERFDGAKVTEAPETMAGIESGRIRRVDVAVRQAAAERSVRTGRSIDVPPPVPRTPWDRLGCARGDVRAAEQALLDGEDGGMTRAQFEIRAREIQGILIRMHQLYRGRAAS
jgi:hypothetical protein